MRLEGCAHEGPLELVQDSGSGLSQNAFKTTSLSALGLPVLCAL